MVRKGQVPLLKFMLMFLFFRLAESFACNIEQPESPARKISVSTHDRSFFDRRFECLNSIYPIIMFPLS